MPPPRKDRSPRGFPPGYCGTPEWPYVRRRMAEVPPESIKEETGTLLTMQGAYDRGGRDVLRELHEHGYTQVADMPDALDFFPAAMIEQLQRRCRQAEMADTVFRAIQAQGGMLD